MDELLENGFNIPKEVRKGRAVIHIGTEGNEDWCVSVSGSNISFLMVSKSEAIRLANKFCGV